MVTEIKSKQEFYKAFKEEKLNIVTCPYCYKIYAIDWTEKETDMMMEWSQNRFTQKAILIQDALPNRNIYEREIMRYAWIGSESIKCSENCTYPIKKE